MFLFKGLGFFMIGTFSLIDFTIVIDVFLGLLMNPINLLFLLGDDFIMLGLDGSHRLIDLVGFAMQVLQ